MAWQIELSKPAAKTLKKIDRQFSQRIYDMLQQKVAPAADPRSYGHSLGAEKRFKGLWSYRAGPWRMIADIRDKERKIVIVDIDDRKQVYSAEEPQWP